MKRTIITYATSIALTLIIAAPALAALILPTPPPTGGSPGLTGSGVVKIIEQAVNYFIIISTTVAVGFFIWGGIKYASGDSAKGKEILWNATVGLLAILGVGLVIRTIAGLIDRGGAVG